MVGFGAISPHEVETVGIWIRQNLLPQVFLFANSMPGLAIEIALIVAGQIRTLSDPRLVSNWEANVLLPLHRPKTFMSLNRIWSAASWVIGEERENHTGARADDEAIDRIKTAFRPEYFAVTDGLVHTSRVGSRGGPLDWFRSWSDAYSGMETYEIVYGKRFDVVIHARPDLVFMQRLVLSYFWPLVNLSHPFALYRWDYIVVMSRDLAKSRLDMIRDPGFLSGRDAEYCVDGPTDQCNLMWFLAHQPRHASVRKWDINAAIQRKCGSREAGSAYKVLRHGICDRGFDPTKQRARLLTHSRVEWHKKLRCTITSACKLGHLRSRSKDCFAAADAVLSDCHCEFRLNFSMPVEESYRSDGSGKIGEDNHAFTEQDLVADTSSRTLERVSRPPSSASASADGTSTIALSVCTERCCR